MDINLTLTLVGKKVERMIKSPNRCISVIRAGLAERMTSKERREGEEGVSCSGVCTSWPHLPVLSIPSSAQFPLYLALPPSNVLSVLFISEMFLLTYFISQNKIMEERALKPLREAFLIWMHVKCGLKKKNDLLKREQTWQKPSTK